MQINRKYTKQMMWGLGVLLLVFSVGAAGAKSFMTTGFSTGSERPLKLILLPPHADFVKSKAVMTEQMVKESQALEDAAAREILAHLKSKGYEVRYLTSDEINASPELRDLVHGINDRYHEEWSSFVRRPKGVRQGRYSVGDDVVRLCSLLDVDGVLISRIQAVGITVGKAILLSLFGAPGGPASYGRLDVSVVGGGDGDVDAYFFRVQGASLKQLTNRPDVIMRKACKKGLKALPRVGEALSAAQIAQGEENEEEDIVSEFEALLVAEKESGGGGG